LPLPAAFFGHFGLFRVAVRNPMGGTIRYQ
jgi:hypothetical protein